MKKKISRIATLGAFIMALSCTLKITAFHFGLAVLAQWINVVMNAVIVYGCYELGRLVGLSRSHRLLCATAILGYVFYGVILVLLPATENHKLSIGVLLFFMLTLVMSVWFFVDLILRSLRQTEADLEKLEKKLEK